MGNGGEPKLSANCGISRIQSIQYFLASVLAMQTSVQPSEACPRCNLFTHVTRKLILIDPANSRPIASQSVWRASCACEGLSVDDLKPEFATEGQFILGMYCDSCAVGFVPEYMAKPAAPKYQSGPDGWRRVFTDGTLGPLLQRISDDPESQIR